MGIGREVFKRAWRHAVWCAAEVGVSWVNAQFTRREGGIRDGDA